MKFKYLKLISAFLLATLILTGCATYYQKQVAIQTNFESGNFEGAEKLITSKKATKEANGKNRLLYWLNAGTIAYMLGKNVESNDYFEKAYIFTEDYKKNYATSALSLVTNPMATTYAGEDVEVLMINYYKALNFLAMGNTEYALVEVRRMYQKSLVLSDKYKGANRFKRDAFIQTFMGLIFEASGDDNNAFVCMRNAYTIYKEDYSKFFKMSVPEQLKKDLIRLSYKNGTSDFLSFYEKEFGMKYEAPAKSSGGEAIVLWNNGLGPVKDEWSINFVVVKGAGGMVNFTNDEYGFNFPFILPSGQGEGNLSDLTFLRVVMPKYNERPLQYSNGFLSANGAKYEFSLIQDVNAVAVKCLKDRVIQDLSEELLRVAIKKAAEYALRNQNQYAGAALGVLNAITEKADTRNWQTIPHDISYARVPLNEGENTIQLQTGGNYGTKQVDYKVKGRAGQSAIVPLFTTATHGVIYY